MPNAAGEKAEIRVGYRRKSTPGHMTSATRYRWRRRGIAGLLAVAIGAAGVVAVSSSPLAAQVSLGVTTWQSVGTDEATGDRITPIAPSSDPSLSADGRFVVFESEAILASPDANRPGDAFEDADVYRRDRDADEDGIFDEEGLDPVTGEVQTRTELVSVGYEQPVPGLSVGDPAPVAEGNLLVFPVTLSFVAPPGGVMFRATTGAGGDTAVAPGDYTAVSSQQFTIPAGSTSTNVFVFTTEDSIFETPSNETMTLTLSDVVRASAGDVVGVGTITDDDPQPSLFVQDDLPADAALDVSNTEGTPPGAQRTLLFTVRLSGLAPAGGVSFRVTTQDGTAAAGSDYEPRDFTLNIPAGTNASSFAVFIVADAIGGCFDSSTETVIVNISEVVGDVTVSDPQGVGGIVNDDDPTCITLRQPVPSKTNAPVPSRTDAPPIQCLMECGSPAGKAGAGASGTSAATTVVGPIIFARAPRSAPAQAPPPTPGTPIPADEPSANPVVSGDGRLVAFESTANNLLVDHFESDDVQSQSDVFVRDMDTGTTYLVSPSPATGHTHHAGAPSISSDGTKIAFLVEIEEPPGCEFDCLDSTIIHADITNLAGPVSTTPLTEALDTDFDGAADVSGLPAPPGNEWTPGPPVISSDGQHVAVEVGGLADDMIAAFDVGDPRWDRVDATVGTSGQLVGLPGSVDQAGLPPALSGDGRLVLFTHQPAAAAAVPSQVRLVDRDVDGDGTFGFDPALVDGWFQTVSEFAGSEGNDDSEEPSITPDGQYVSFSTRSTNLGSIAGTACDNQCVDILVRDRLAPAGSPLELATVAQFDEPADGHSSRSALAASGRYVAFQTFAENLLPGFPDPTPDPSVPSGGLISDDNNFVSDIYVREFTPELIGTPDPLTFGTVLLGDSSILSVTFEHVGFGPLNPASISITGAAAGDFTVNGETCTGLTLHQGDECVVSVRYTPSATGTRDAVLGVANDGATSPATVGLTGGAGPKVATFDAEPDELVFPETLGLTTTAPATTTITNTGNVPITLNAVTIEGVNASDFTISANTCTGVTLVPGATCAVSVTFTPTAPGDRSAALRFDDTAAGSPHLIGLRGTGAAPTLVVNPGVARGGQVAAVTGTNFPPNRTITLVWTNAGPGGLTLGGFPEPAHGAATLADGTFVSEMVVFPKSTTGGRVLLGAVEGFAAIQPFLVVPESVQGPDFIIRS